MVQLYKKGFNRQAHPSLRTVESAPLRSSNITMMWTVVFLGVLGVSMANVMMPEYQNTMLQLHNEGRQMMGEGDFPNEYGEESYPFLRWNEDLAREAQRYANRCQFRYSSRPEFGENLYIEQSSRSEEGVMNRGYNAWRNGVDSFRFDDRECSPSQSCYYSQVNWEETREFGCAMNNCNYMSQFREDNDVRFLVCYYEPRGNWMGEEAYEPAK
ncbi:pathogenesis-related protein PRB1-3-like [Haliotis rubra]|uniref:pathogenesis-related protein PRB1-3-like n=1 Tax=Haliotis rubra TaxID=36100 RepID=UPI001EE6287D|nr:pathogenesis-related protein PRB1-3-like [Haliotis rubra]